MLDGPIWIWSKHYETDKSNWLYETSHKFNILCNRQLLDCFAVHIESQMILYKNNIYPIRKSDINRNDKKDQNKSLIDEG